MIKPENNITLLRIFLKDDKPQKRQHKIYPRKTLDRKNPAKELPQYIRCQIQAKTNTRDKRVSLSPPPYLPETKYVPQQKVAAQN